MGFSLNVMAIQQNWQNQWCMSWGQFNGPVCYLCLHGWDVRSLLVTQDFTLSNPFHWLTFYRLPTKLREGYVFSSVCPSVIPSMGVCVHVTIIYDELDLTVQPPPFWTWDLVTPPGSDIWWSSLQTCSICRQCGVSSVCACVINTVHSNYKHSSQQWRVHDFPEGMCLLLLFGIIFAESCMKMKKK